jgi:hypothetical protein
MCGITIWQVIGLVVSISVVVSIPCIITYFGKKNAEKEVKE